MTESSLWRFHILEVPDRASEWPDSEACGDFVCGAVPVASGGVNAAESIPTEPAECSKIEPWEGASGKQYPPGSCVHYGKYIWTNDEHAGANQRPGRRDWLWEKIGDYIPPGGLQDLVVSVSSGSTPPQPTVYVVNRTGAEAGSSIVFAELPANTTRKFKYVPRAGVEGEVTKLKVLAEKEGEGGYVYPVLLRAQRNTTGTGPEGVRVPIDATGGNPGPGALIVWYEPGDNAGLESGKRYRTKPGTRLKMQVIGADLPGYPVLDTFRLGVDIVAR